METDSLDEELTEEDLMILEAATENELRNNENSPNVSIRMQPIKENAETRDTPETVDDADFTNFFEDDGEPELEDLECLKSKFRHQCFRSKLDVLRQKLPNIPILAVTATATENVRYDIVTLLGLNEPRVIMTSFDRTNLEMIVKRKTTVISDILPLIKDVDGSLIVYVLKRESAKAIAKQLNDNGIVCDHYHAGLDIPKRTEVLNRFLNDELRVIVATIAFGMGIDKKDIRCVIHYGASKNLESYYQEVGRAGRDGKHAKVITYFSPDDFELHDWFLEKLSTEHQMSAVIMNYLRSLGAKMRDFLYSTQCRRKIILEYFGENTQLTPRPNFCDNCTVGLGSWSLTDLYEDIDDDGIYDFSIESKILLEAIKCFLTIIPHRRHYTSEPMKRDSYLCRLFILNCNN